jgi:hypothetical protein
MVKPAKQPNPLARIVAARIVLAAKSSSHVRAVATICTGEKFRFDSLKDLGS